MAVLMYNIMCVHTPDYLESLFSRYVLRASARGEIKELTIPLTCTKTGDRSYRVQGASLWNSLPAAIRNFSSLSRFKLPREGISLTLTNHPLNALHVNLLCIAQYTLFYMYECIY